MSVLAQPAARRRPTARRGRAAAAPAVVGTATALPGHRYRQADLARIAAEALPEEMLRAGLLERFFASVRVDRRCFVVPADRIRRLGGFKERNDIYIETALDLGEVAVRSALADAEIDACDVGLLASTSVTGIAVPSLDARLMNRIDFAPTMARMPFFGFGCVGGAAGVARVADWLRGHPQECAVLLAVETCSLAFQLDRNIANLISVGLFGDGAAAVVLAGARHPLAQGDAEAPRARVLGSRSAFFPDTERVMGWDIGDNGFTPVLSPEVPAIVHEHAPPLVDALLAEHGLERGDVGRWVMHPGGPKVIDAMEESLGLREGALAETRRHLASVGNLSSASILFLLDEHRRASSAGDGRRFGVMLAMGPAFCAEAVLLGFEGGQ